MIIKLKKEKLIPKYTLQKLHNILSLVDIKYYLSQLLNKNLKSEYITSISDVIQKYAHQIEGDVYFELKNFNDTSMASLKIKKYNDTFYIIPCKTCLQQIDLNKKIYLNVINSF